MDDSLEEKIKETMIECCHMVGKLKAENDELKYYLKAAVDEMAILGDRCSDNSIHCQSCPFDECGKFTFHNQILKFINEV